MWFEQLKLQYPQYNIRARLLPRAMGIVISVTPKGFRYPIPGQLIDDIVRHYTQRGFSVYVKTGFRGVAIYVTRQITQGVA